MSRFPGAIRRIAEGVAMRFGQKRFAIVTSVDPNTYTAKVQIMPDGVEWPTWLPIGTPWIGMVCPPNTDDQVTVSPQDGDANNLVVGDRVYSQQQRPPVGVPGEFWLVHIPTGTFLKLQNSGNVAISAAQAMTLSATGPVTINAPAGATINGNAAINGNLLVTGNIGCGANITAVGTITPDVPGA